MKAYLFVLSDSQTVEMAKMTRGEFVEAVKKAAAGESSLTSSEFEKRSGIPRNTTYQLFPEGGWKEVLKLAGLNDEGSTVPISDEEILSEFHTVVMSIGKIPTWFLFDNKSRISKSVVKKRFGGMYGTLRRYKDWLIINHPSSPMIKKVEEQIKDEPRRESIPLSPSSTLKWPKVDGTEYGEPINFRGLRHAPINELGVVYLFGMIAEEMGFLVEALHTAYPDCEAKRIIKGSGKRWQRVLIEFEYRSSNFIEHGHDVKKCDMIVCWEHNWPECPIEVIELRKVLEELD